MFNCNESLCYTFDLFVWLVTVETTTLHGGMSATDVKPHDLKELVVEMEDSEAAEEEEDLEEDVDVEGLEEEEEVADLIEEEIDMEAETDHTRIITALHSIFLHSVKRIAIMLVMACIYRVLVHKLLSQKIQHQHA